MIAARSLTKTFGVKKAVDDISLDVRKGEVLGFLGPNGAGKSTTMKMITGFLRPTAGTASICGADVLDDPIAAKRRLGYLPEGAPLYSDMAAAEFLKFVARARGLSGAKARSAIDDVIGKTNLAPVLAQPIETLSKGFKRRVGLAQALLHDPDVLILDEPTDGLDPNQKHEVRALIREISPRKAIIISTHILEEVEAVCSRAVIIAGGRLIADGTPAELAGRSRFDQAVAVTVDEADADRVRAVLEGLPGVASVVVERAPRLAARGHSDVIAIPKDGSPMLVPQVAALVEREGWSIHGLRTERGQLEDVFRTLTMPPKASTSAAITSGRTSEKAHA